MLLVAIRHVNFSHSSDKKSSLDLFAGVNTMMSFLIMLLLLRSFHLIGLIVGNSFILCPLFLNPSSYDAALQLRTTRGPMMKTMLKGIPTRVIRCTDSGFRFSVFIAHNSFALPAQSFENKS